MNLAYGNIRTTGRAARLPEALNVRALSATEVDAHSAREVGEKVPPLKRLSSRHRHLARLIACGRTTSEAALATGLTASRVSILRSDPTFCELVAHFQHERDELFESFEKQMAGLAEDVVAELRTRIEENADQFDNGELERLLSRLADRTGHAPKRVEEKNINFNIGQRLDEARRRVEALPAKIIDGELVGALKGEVT